MIMRWPQSTWRWIAARAVLLVAAGTCAGCGHEPTNLSPLASDDPARQARAAQEELDVERANRRAEAEFYRRAHAKPVAPEPSDAGSITQESQIADISGTR